MGTTLIGSYILRYTQRICDIWIRPVTTFFGYIPVVDVEVVLVCAAVERDSVYLHPLFQLEILLCSLLGSQVSVCVVLAVRDCWGSADWRPELLSSPLVGLVMCVPYDTCWAVLTLLFLCV